MFYTVLESITVANLGYDLSSGSVLDLQKCDEQ